MNELLDAACEHRQEKVVLQKRVKTLEQDLAVAKQTCKDQEYHIAQAAAGGGPDFKQERQVLLPAGVGERQEWQVLRSEMCIRDSRHPDLPGGQGRAVGQRQAVLRGAGPGRV